MKRSWYNTLSRMKYFERIGTTATSTPKAAPWKKNPLLQHHPKSNKMQPLWRKLSGVLFWRRPGKKEARSSPQVTCTSTPENTSSLLDLDDLSVCRDVDSYMFQSFSAESNDPLMRGGGGGGTYSYWEHRPTVVNETLSLDSSDSSEIGRLEAARNTRLRRSLMAVLKKTRSRSTSSTSYSPTSDDPDDESQSTEHFSISEVVPPASTYQCPCVTISVTVGDETPDIKSNSSASRSYTMSYSQTDRSGSFTTLSLDQFMDEKQKEAESIMTGPIALAEVDGASVGSACLDVAFDGDYPQLVLTPSHDGTLSRITGSVVTHSPQRQQRATLGVSYPHPCSGAGGSNRSVGSFDTAKKNTSCTPRWLNENIDRVWKQIDRNKSDLDGSASNYSDSYFQSESDQSRDVPEEVMSEQDEQRINEFIYRYTKEGESMDLSDDVTEASLSDDASEGMEEDILEEDVPIEPVQPEVETPKEGFTWVEDLCSFSAEESALSITNMIEKDVIHPLLKPICHLVEATEIPESAMCGSKYRRPPLSRHVNSSKYRMTPQTSQPRLPSHQN
jgi:hypothetical protein